MSIVVSSAGKGATKIDRITVESEDYLQRYIHENPESLPLDEYKDDLQLLILAREFPTGSGPIDALGVDQDGEVYLIETKLYKNPDKRLVLAQVLDYGASLWRTYGDPEEFITRLQTMVSEHFGTSLSDKLEDKFESAAWNVDDYLEAVRDNVSAGSFRFVVLMDRIEERLKDLITFMNQNSRFDVFGVELEFYRHADLEILIPKLFGAEVKKNVGGSSGSSARRKWDEETFFADVSARLASEQVAAVRELYRWTESSEGRITWGTGAQRGSFSPKFERVNKSRSIFTVYSDGELSLNFGWFKPPDPASAYAKRLGEALRSDLQDLRISPNFASQYVTVPVEIWGRNLRDFTRILERVLSGGPSRAEGPGQTA